MAEYKDLAERTLATFIQAAIGAMGTNSVMDLGVDNWKMIAMAGASAALAVVKGWAASKFGDRSPSMMS
tara:strand:- start:215 stop:421 length:207 start_codon:yes stop_codon:yes gene_type:complete